MFCKELSAILAKLPAWKTFFRLLDLDPNVYFYVKNRRKQFLWMNDTLRKSLGIEDITSCIGKTDYDYSPADLAFLYRQEDDTVFNSRQEIINQPWILSTKSGCLNWSLSSKVPLFVDSKLVGLAGIMRTVSEEIVRDPLNEFRPVVEYILHNSHEPLRIEELASIMYLSVSQFERRFLHVFRMTPSEFLLKVRIDSSIRLLIDTDSPITQVALQTGFYDNSHYTRNFKKKVGITPLEFRKRYAKYKPALSKLAGIEEIDATG
jgi:AraC-like DNA-binding protein